MKEDPPLRMNKIIPVRFQEGYVNKYRDESISRTVFYKPARPGKVSCGKVGKSYPSKCKACKQNPIYKHGLCLECHGEEEGFSL